MALKNVTKKRTLYYMYVFSSLPPTLSSPCHTHSHFVPFIFQAAARNGNHKLIADMLKSPVVCALIILFESNSLTSFFSFCLDSKFRLAECGRIDSYCHSRTGRTPQSCSITCKPLRPHLQDQKR